MARPAYRLIAKPKKNGKFDGDKPVECATLWASQLEGFFNLRPTTKEDAGDNPWRKPLTEVLKDADEYWLNVTPNQPKDEEEDF